MAFPVVESVTPTSFNTNATSHLVAYPATVNSGDLIVVIFMSTSVDAVTVPAAFTSLHTTTSGGSIRMTSGYRIADGSEDGGTSDWVTATGRRAVAHLYRISAWHGTTPPEVGTAATGSSVNPDPPTLSPSWGSDDTLWLAGFASVAAVTVSVYPTNYTDGSVNTFTAGAGGAVGSARRNLAATSDDPSALTISATGVWVAQTYAVRPAAGGAATVTPAVIAVTTSLPTPTILAASTVTPAVIPATASLPLPTAQGQAKPTPAVIAATVSLPTPTILAAAKTTPAVIPATVTLPTPTVLAAAKVTPAVIAVTATLPTPTINVAGTGVVTPAVIAVTVTLPTPTVTAPGTVTPAVIAATVTLPTPTAQGQAKASPAVIPVTVSLPTPTIIISSADAVVTPAVIAATAALPTPTILAAAVITPSTIAVLVGLPTPTVFGETAVTPATILVTVTFPGPVIIIGAMTFWQPDPAGYTLAPVGFTPVKAGDTPPWN